jgi:hypothetical protein
MEETRTAYFEPMSEFATLLRSIVPLPLSDQAACPQYNGRCIDAIREICSRFFACVPLRPLGATLRGLPTRCPTILEHAQKMHRMMRTK